MLVSFELPQDIERALRTDGIDLNREAKEVFLLDLFRRGAIGHFDLARTLGLDRFETDALLHRRGVAERSLSDRDVDADVASIDELLTPPGL